MVLKKDEIKLENGKSTKAFSPVIISASRRTDIPAFYSDWFFHRLNVGYSAWINPFNGIKNYVSYKNTRFIIFWSKNPQPLLTYLPVLKKRNICCYIQYTLNDYENEKLETGIPPLENRTDTFKALSKELGKKAVIWRFDPMILTDKITIDDLLEKVERIGSQIHEYTEKMVFSYVDILLYRKVKSNLDKNKVAYNEWTEEEMDEFAKKLSELNKRLNWNLQLTTCCEKIDIEKYDIKHNRCIDGDLIVQLAWKDEKLMKAMKVKIETMSSHDIFGKTTLPSEAILLPENHYFTSIHKKDNRQRACCGCMNATDIGEYNTCPHLCEYCYANANKEIALRNWKIHCQNPQSENLLCMKH